MMKLILRLPLKPCQSHQISSEDPSKKHKKKVKDKRIYTIIEVFNNMFLSECLADSVFMVEFLPQLGYYVFH